MRNINVDTINNALTNNKERCEKVLSKIGCTNIKYNESQHLLYCRRPGGDNSHGILCYIDSCRVIATTNSAASGNIITLVMYYKDCNFPKALELIANWIGIEDKKIILKYPFNHFYKNLVSDKSKSIVELDKYPEEILKQYSGLSKKFLDDGVDLLTQEKFGISFSHDDNAIAIPIRDLNGRLVGVKMRNNDNDCDYSNRFWSAYRYQKTGVVYGLYDNYMPIIKKSKLIICEAEKAVLQARSFGCEIVVAIGGHSISNQQANIIKSCMVDKIIVAFDSDICYDEAEFEAKKLLVDNKIFSNKVGVMDWSKSNKLSNKISPTDFGRDYFKDCMKGVKWIGN